MRESALGALIGFAAVAAFAAEGGGLTCEEASLEVAKDFRQRDFGIVEGGLQLYFSINTNKHQLMKTRTRKRK